MRFFCVSYYVTNDGYDSASGTPFHIYTACTQILVVGEAHFTFSRILLWITTTQFVVVLTEKLFCVSYYVTNDGYDSASGTPFHTYTACTQILVVGEAHFTFSRILLWITKTQFVVVLTEKLYALTLFRKPCIFCLLVL